MLPQCSPAHVGAPFLVPKGLSAEGGQFPWQATPGGSPNRTHAERLARPDGLAGRLGSMSVGWHQALLAAESFVSTDLLGESSSQPDLRTGNLYEAPGAEVL